MPTYDYRCPDCKNDISLERSMSDNSTPACSNCGGQNLNRIWGVFMMGGGSSAPTTSSTTQTSGSTKKSGCGSCSSHSCGTC